MVSLFTSSGVGKGMECRATGSLDKGTTTPMSEVGDLSRVHFESPEGILPTYVPLDPVVEDLGLSVDEGEYGR